MIASLRITVLLLELACAGQAAGVSARAAGTYLAMITPCAQCWAIPA